MFQTKVVEEIKTHIVCSIPFFVNRAVYEIIWENIAERGKPRMTIWRMRISITKLYTYSAKVLLTAFPLQQRLYGSASMLRYKYIANIIEVVFANTHKILLPLIQQSLKNISTLLLTYILPQSCHESRTY